MSEKDKKVVDAMTKYGGNFVVILAEAVRLADAENLEKIKTTWSEYWSRYSAIAEREASERCVFRVPLSFVFGGYCDIRARDEEEAARAAAMHVGLTLGGNIHSTLPEEDVSWELQMHPTKTVGTPYPLHEPTLE